MAHRARSQQRLWLRAFDRYMEGVRERTVEGKASCHLRRPAKSSVHIERTSIDFRSLYGWVKMHKH